MKRVDMCGYSCPEPVIRAMELAKSGESEFEIAVDSNVSKENVVRFLEENGYLVTVLLEDGIYVLRSKK